MSCTGINDEDLDLHVDSLNSPSGTMPLPQSRIAMVIPHLRNGGAERVALSIAGGLLERGHHVDMIVLGKGVDYPNEVPERLRLLVLNDPREVATRRMQNSTLKTFFAVYIQAAKFLNWRIGILPSIKRIRSAIWLTHYINLSKPNFVVPHMQHSTMIAQLASSMAVQPVPVIPVVHNIGREMQFPRRQRQYWSMLRHAQKVIVVSRAVKKAVERHTMIPHSQIEVVHNGVHAGSVELLSRERPDHKWFRESGVPVVLGVGRLVPQKDWPTLMRAFCLLRKRIKCHLLILGRGPKEKCLKNLSLQLGISEDFDNPGFSGNPFQYMRHSSVMGLSSEFEGLGMVLLEALACGCPCVSTDIGGPQEILENGRYGALVPVGNHEAMADALEQAIRNPPPRDVLRQRAQEFSVERCVTGYERVLASVAKKVAG